MIAKMLRTQLEPVLQRRSRLRRRTATACCLSAAAVIAAVLLAIYAAVGWWNLPVVLALAGTAMVAVVWLQSSIGRAEPDYVAVARQIEQTNPSLQALLLAAVEQSPDFATGQLGYLQERVVAEALQHAKRHGWIDSVSPRAMACATGGQWAATLACGVLLALLLRPALPAPDEAGFVWTRSSALRVEVTPGDVEIERGADVVVMARFDGGEPGEATLLVGQTDDTLAPVALQRSLDDPIFGGAIRSVEADLLYRVEYDGKSTPLFRVKVYEHPELQQADAHVVAPQYTGLEAKTLKDVRRVSAVQGSSITVEFHLNKPVERAELVTADGGRLKLERHSENPNTYTLDLTADTSQRFTLELVDVDGRSNKMPTRFTVDVLANLRPDLAIKSPRGDIEVSPLEEVTFDAEISDDFGLGGQGLTYTVAGQAPVDVPIASHEASRRKRSVRFMLSMEDLAVQPAQLVSYYFWAEDLGPDGEMRRTFSDMFLAEIRPFEEIFREALASGDQQQQQRQQQQQQRPGSGADQLTQLQKQVINATWRMIRELSGGKATKKVREDLAVVRDGQAETVAKAAEMKAELQDAEAVRHLGRAMKSMSESLEMLTAAATADQPVDPLSKALGFEQAAYQALLKLRAVEHEVTRGRQSQRGGGQGGNRSRQQLNQLELQQEDRRYETESQARELQQLAQNQNLQILSRLRELAERQSDLNRQLREAQAELEAAPDDRRRERLQRQLDRLREEQQKILRDLDETRQRMNEPGNRNRMAESREQLDRTREQVQRASDALNRGETEEAVAAGTRAQRSMEELRDEFRRETSSRFADAMQEMRSAAREMSERQEQIDEDLRQVAEKNDRSLGKPAEQERVEQELDAQQRRVADLADQMRRVSEASEQSEPVLSNRLYDTLRKADTQSTEQMLRQSADWLRANFVPEARLAERRAAEGVERLARGVERAAEAVLGSEAEALRTAQNALENLSEQVERELEAQTGRARGGAQDSPPDTRDQPAGRDPAVGFDRLFNDENFGDPNGPIVGRDFRNWSDRMREVEQMLSQSELRNRAAEVRERVRDFRTDFKRHGKEPQWELVEQLVLKPLDELRERVKEELARKESDRAVTPIDRDPVPARFAELVRRYYERLGKGE